MDEYEWLRGRPAKASLWFLCGIWGGPALGAADYFVPYVGAKYTQDSNFFRVANDAEAIALTGSTDRTETIYHLIAGVSGELPVSRQLFTLSAEADKGSYQRFDELDNTALNADLGWKWQAGRLWSGALSYVYDESLTRFNELSQVVKDIETSQEFSGDAGLQVSPNWRLIGGVNSSTQDYDKRPNLDSSESAYSGELQYFTTANTKVGVRYLQRDAEFEQKQTITDPIAGPVQVSNDFTQTEYSLVAYWESTAKSHFAGRLGQTKTEYNELSSRDFSGGTWRVDYDWLASAKTTVKFALWNDTSVAPETAELTTQDGFRVSPVWQMTEKLRLRGYYEAKTEKFEAQAAASGAPVREDDSERLGVALVYSVVRTVRATFDVAYDKRDSTVDDRDFTSTRWSLRLDASF